LTYKNNYFKNTAITNIKVKDTGLYLTMGQELCRLPIDFDPDSD